MRRVAMTAIVALALLAGARGQENADEAITPIELLRTNDYSEGIVQDHFLNLYFSHGKIITKMKPDGSGAVVWAETGEPNGHKILGDQSHLVCDASRHAVLHLDASGKELAPASTESEGQPLRGPNDLTIDIPNGGFYFTDPGGSDDKNPIGTVHYVDRTGKTFTVASGLAFPNGIVLRPDGRTLLVAESKKNRILSYPVLAPGKLGPMTVFADLPVKGAGQIDNQPDGMCLDQNGTLYVAHYGMRTVEVISPEGKLIRQLPGGNLTTSNVCFAGPNFDQLFVTGGEPGAVFRLDVRARGLPILPALTR